MKRGGGGAKNLVYGSLFSLIMAFFVFSVMSEFNLDDPGFTPPIPPVPPISSDSSVETPVDGRRKCSYLVSPAFEPLSQAYFRTPPLTTLFLLALATANMGWGATGSLFHGHLCG